MKFSFYKVLAVSAIPHEAYGLPVIKVNASLYAIAILHSSFAVMKSFLAILLLFFIGLSLHAQDITGIWRGYFYQGYGIYRQQYKYEIQIDQLNGKKVPGNAKAIKGVTYSYRMTSFYGKANFVGIYSDQTKEITLSEDTLVEVKMNMGSFSCLMTCYLDYHKTGETEVLQGTFSSVVDKKGTDCGSGSVYLERVQESDFHKEDFLVKKHPEDVDIKTRTRKPVGEPTIKKDAGLPPKKNSPVVAKRDTATHQTKPPQTAKATPPKKHVPARDSSARKIAIKPHVTSTTDSVVKAAAPVQPMVVAPPTAKLVERQLPPVPEVVKERTNPLVKTIVTNSTDIKIELYDNGEIDGDTITVYHNNALVAFKRGLTAKPITINLKASTEDPHHELIMVADNLGTIPPNTALMVVTTGGKRYEVFISSDEEHNAKVVIDYKAP